jgi:hypothetical protein
MLTFTQSVLDLGLEVAVSNVAIAQISDHICFFPVRKMDVGVGACAVQG